mmetsp:Transcript_4823/g.9199  ORF Transcript_4823/g.9199 Transcript_4823/m.9199 type:complete len:405 (+) Transcript_4823:143-1357(+)
MQSDESNKRKYARDLLKRRIVKQKGPTARSNSGNTGLTNATEPKSCRFLACASRLADKHAFVVLMPSKDTRVSLPEHDGDETSQREEGCSKNNHNKSQKKKKKSGTKSFTTCHLPKVGSTCTDWIIISPQDAIARSGGETIYKHIEIHVKPLLVLDVNGILCHRVRDKELPAPLLLLASMYKDRDMDLQTLYRQRIGRIAQTDIIPRTDLEDFLDFLIEHYNLALWSSAKKATVKKLIDLMFPGRIKERLIFVWGQEKCECLPLEVDDTIANGAGPKVIFRKHLSKVWNDFPLWNRSNTLLMDDSPEKCVKYKENSIHPPPIMGLNMDALARHMDSLSLQVSDDVSSPKIHLDVMCYSDEDNQKKQFRFFQDLTATWRDPKDEGDGFLMQFLDNNARCHMNWNA